MQLKRDSFKTYLTYKKPITEQKNKDKEMNFNRFINEPTSNAFLAISAIPSIKQIGMLYFWKIWIPK